MVRSRPAAKYWDRSRYDDTVRNGECGEGVVLSKIGVSGRGASGEPKTIVGIEVMGIGTVFGDLKGIMYLIRRVVFLKKAVDVSSETTVQRNGSNEWVILEWKKSEVFAETLMTRGRRVIPTEMLACLEILH